MLFITYLEYTPTGRALRVKSRQANSAWWCIVQASKKGKPAMMFSTLDKIKDKGTGEKRERTKEETEEVAFRYKNLMQSGHLDTTPYVIDPGKILWTVHVRSSHPCIAALRAAAALFRSSSAHLHKSVS